jgi:peptide/nickel transport system substrate-binding protein
MSMPGRAGKRVRASASGRVGAIRTPVALCYALAAALALAAAGLAASRAARLRPERAANVLRLAVPTDLQSIDPAIAYDDVSWPVVRLVFQGLLDYEEDGRTLKPWLAREMPALSADGRTYTIHLRPGVRFSDGRPVEAKDFVYSLERILDPATRSPGEGFFRGIEGATAFQAAREREQASRGAEGQRSRGAGEGRGGRRAAPEHVAGLQAVDPGTLVIRLTKPDPTFLYILAMPFAFVVEPEAAERWGEDFLLHPVGTGPYVLAEWQRDLRMRFRRNRYYYLPGHPRIDEVVVNVGIDELLQEMMFERGELDVMYDIPAPDFVRVTRDPRWRPCVTSLVLNEVQYLALNCELKPFDDVRVRQAMNYAVDKERLARLINGRAVPAAGVLPPGMPGYVRRPGYPHDPARAKNLLRQAGYADGFHAELWVIADRSQDIKMSQGVQQDLAQVGVHLDLKNVAFAEWSEATGRRRNVACCYTGWFQDYPDPSDFLDVLLNGARITDVHCNNLSFYSNPRVNRLLDRAGAERDPARRLQLYREAEDLVVADAPWVFLEHLVQYRLHQTRLKGYRMHLVWPQRFEICWFEAP